MKRYGPLIHSDRLRSRTVDCKPGPPPEAAVRFRYDQGCEDYDFVAARAGRAGFQPSPFADDDDGDSLAKLLADMEEEFGPPSPEAYAWADEVMRSALRGGTSQ